MKLLSFKSPESLFLISNKWRVGLSLALKNNYFPAATHLRAFVIVLFLCSLSHTLLYHCYRVQATPSSNSTQRCCYLLFSSWLQQSLLTSSCTASIWDHSICIRAHILDGTCPVLFLSTPGDTQFLTTWSKTLRLRTSSFFSTLFLMYIEIMTQETKILF